MPDNERCPVCDRVKAAAIPAPGTPRRELAAACYDQFSHEQWTAAIPNVGDRFNARAWATEDCAAHAVNDWRDRCRRAREVLEEACPPESRDLRPLFLHNQVQMALACLRGEA